MPELETPRENPKPLLKPCLGRIGQIYRSEWAIFRTDYKRYFKWAARVLGIGFVLGYLVFYFRPELAQKGLAYVLRSLKDIPVGGPPLVLAATLFYHNSLASLLAAAAGVVPFIGLPIFDPLVNGAALGLISAISGRMGQNVPLLLLKGVAPHGVFEIPAVLYATAIGIYLSVRLGKKVLAVIRGTRAASGPGEGVPAVLDDPARAADQGITPPNAGPLGSDPQAPAPTLGKIFAQAVRSFVLVVLPLLLVAAFIEAYITPLLV